MRCDNCGVTIPRNARICCTCMTVIPHEGETIEQAREIAKAQCAKMLQQAQWELVKEERAEEERAKTARASVLQPDAIKAGAVQPSVAQTTGGQTSRVHEPVQGAVNDPIAQQPPVQLPTLAHGAEHVSQQNMVAMPHGMPAVSNGIPAVAARSQQEFAQKPAKASTSALAITSLVCGIVAIGTSFLPIVNNVSFFVALIGLAFAIAGLVSTRKKGKKGQGMAVAGTILAIVSIFIVLASQSYYGSVIDQFRTGLQQGQKPVSTSSQNADYSHMPIGQSVTLENGLTISVNSVSVESRQYGSGSITRINVSYTNNGSSNADFNMFDWKAEDQSGAIRMITAYGGGGSDLSSGDLTPGGSVTGDIFYDGNDISKIYYYSNALIQQSSEICWIV